MKGLSIWFFCLIFSGCALTVNREPTSVGKLDLNADRVCTITENTTSETVKGLQGKRISSNSTSGTDKLKNFLANVPHVIEGLTLHKNFWYYEPVTIDPENVYRISVEAHNFHMDGLTTTEIQPLDSLGKQALVKITTESTQDGQKNVYYEFLCSLL